jgi:predicted dehydrogenase
MMRAGIVGLGRWGRRLVDSVQGDGVEPSEAIRFVAGTTRTASRAADYARSRGIALAADLGALLRDPGVDAIVLATPHSLHAAEVIACAAAGKPVYVEKPLALTLADATAAARACERARVVLAVGHNRRFLPAVRALHALAADGALGTLLHVEGNFSGSFGLEYDSSVWRASESEAPGGGLTLMGIHILDSMIAMMGPIASLGATSLRQVLKIELDDTSAAALRFESGASGYMSTLTATPRLWRLQLFGTAGWAHVLDHEILEVCFVGGEVERRSFAREDTERIALEHFARAVAGDAPFPVALADVLNGIAAMDAFTDSAARDGVPVRLARSA